VLALANPTNTPILLVLQTLIYAILAIVLWRVSGPHLNGRSQADESLTS
jgi:hypothetical protein